MLSDLRFAIRQFAKAPGFAVIVILTLGIGIGAVTTIYSIVHGMLIKPLPYPQPNELVVAYETLMPRRFVSPSAATYLHWKEKATDFESIAAARHRNYNITGAGEPFRVWAQTSTANFFSTLGVQPALGRNFLPDEDTADKAQVVILSHATWKNKFASNPEVVGQTLLLDKVPFTVIGVMPESYQLDPSYEVFTPIPFTADSHHDHKRQYSVMARLKDDVTLQQATAQLKTISDHLASAYPGSHKGYGANLRTLHDEYSSGPKQTLYLLLGAVGFLLLIACTNIANLLLARASARQAEIAVRSALGAGRGRIIRQLLGESMLLACIGGALGMLVGHWGLDIILSMVPPNGPHMDLITIDGNVIAFTCGLTVLTSLIFGLMPALQASRVNLNTTLKDNSKRSSSGSKNTQRLRSGLVITQISLALILLSGAGLFFRSIVKAQESDVGYETETTYQTPILLSDQKYATPQQRVTVINQLVERITSLPEIEAATFTNHSRPNSQGPRTAYSIVGRAAVESKQRPRTIHHEVTRDFFKTFDISLIRGRLFNEQDNLHSPRVALINQEMARTQFANENPIGQQIIFHNRRKEIPREIVGVVSDIRLGGRMGTIRPLVYQPYEQTPDLSTTFLLRTTGAPLDTKTLTATFHSIDPEIPALTMYNLAEGLDYGLKTNRIIVGLFTTFSVVALLLASMGIYGVMAYNVSQRTGEIGIRMALGARSADVFRLVFVHSGKLIIIGMIIGLAGALGMAQLLSSMLYETSPYDPLTLTIITLILGSSAILACWLPACRATKIDPMVALRAE